ncbi:MAG: hypothetical protein JWM20_471 [Patescibacteria group bacterium]|nr:hypothetical protein [Patescibacteria group bacterium]
MHLICISDTDSVSGIPDLNAYFKSKGLSFLQGIVLFTDYTANKKVVDHLQNNGHVRPDLGLPAHIEIHKETNLQTKIKMAGAMHELVFFVGNQFEITFVKESFPECIAVASPSKALV